MAAGRRRGRAAGGGAGVVGALAPAARGRPRFEVDLGQARGAGGHDGPDHGRAQRVRHPDAPHVEPRGLPRRRPHRVDGGRGLGRRPRQRRGHKARRRATGPERHPGRLSVGPLLHHRPGLRGGARAPADLRHRRRHLVDQLAAAGVDGAVQRVLSGAGPAAALPGPARQLREHPRGGPARLRPVRRGAHRRRRRRLGGRRGRAVVEPAGLNGRRRCRSRLRDARRRQDARVRGRADPRSRRGAEVHHR